MAANTARRAHAEVERAARLGAVLAERERLSRHVHDGVLQVLAMVALPGPRDRWRDSSIGRGGRRAGARAAAAAQCRGHRPNRRPRRRRSRIAVAPARHRPGIGERARRPRFTSIPGWPPKWRPPTINALTNVERHAGAGARAYVLLEDLGDEVRGEHPR